MSIRAHQGSNLDLLADSAQARAWGLTRRLHDVTERYAAVIAQSPHRLPTWAIHRLAKGLRTLNGRLATYDPADLRAVLEALWGDTKTVAMPQFSKFSFGQLLALVEDVEEYLANAELAQETTQ